MNYFQKLRADSCLTQEQMARFTGIPYGTWVSWEKGNASPLPWLPPMIEHYVEYRLNGGEAAQPPDGNYMRELVYSCAATQKEFSELIGISKRTIEDWCRGINEPFPWVYPILREWLRYNDLLKREEHAAQ